MRYRPVIPVIIALLVVGQAAGAEKVGMRVGEFVQQVHTAYTVGEGMPSDDVRAVACLPDGTVCVGTKKGLARFNGGVWQPVDGTQGKAIAALAASDSGLLVATARQVFRVVGSEIELAVEIAAGDITSLAGRDDAIWVGTTRGLSRKHGDRLYPIGELSVLLGRDLTVRDIALHGKEVAVATRNGLFTDDGAGWHAVYPVDGVRRWAPQDVRAVTHDGQGQLWFACPQGVGCRTGKDTWKLYTGGEGLPYNDFSSAACGADAVWFGTGIGAVGFADEVWAYREGRRWLVNNEVRDVSVAQNGDLWVATAGGVSLMEARQMTLAEKATLYEDEIDRYHLRTPYGYMVNAALGKPGDKSEWVTPATDNDGQYTGLYCGAECLAYAATGDKRFKERATRTFEALAFLSEVTQGGTHPAPPGFIARAIMPVDGPDPNGWDNPARDRDMQKGDKRWKIIDPRWPVSEDGKWYWKTDTSSDELDGHYFAYGLYFDHVAETEEERARCREVVRRVTDHLIEHDYCLVDHDGKPTRWARFSPKDLNDDPDWWAERGLNSLSILTFLTVAHRVTGDQKYRDAYMDLVTNHQYALNGMVMPKQQAGPGSFVQFDDKMAFMNYYHLIRYETDPALLRMYYTSALHYWQIEKYELNPFFNFVYAACCLGKVREDQWGALDVSPTGAWLEQSVDTLKRYPLDLCNWKTTNSHRIDILPLPDHVREDNGHIGMGYGVNGYVLPIDERQALSWSEDAWALVTGGDGARLRDGCPYLLAYYMGVYHGFITE